MHINTKLDPELEPVLQVLPEIVLNLEDINETRETAARMWMEMTKSQPEIKGVNCRDLQVSGPEGEPDVGVRVYDPANRPATLPGLFWIHGGGYVMGHPEQDDHQVKQFVRESKCVVVSADYRLAPEHPYPAPIEDCYAALKWMFEKADELGVDNTRIAIGGASAGGGLAAGLGLLVRDRAEMKIIFQLLIYPMIDDRNIAQASDELPDAPRWSRHNNLFGWTSYLNKTPGTDGVPPYAAAARANDLSNLPPTFIVVGDADLFVEENITYAQRLIQCGVPVELHIYPGAFHGFDTAVPTAQVSLSCNAAVFQALWNALY